MSENKQKFNFKEILLTTVFTLVFIFQIVMMFFIEIESNILILTYAGWIIWVFSIYFALIPFITFKKRGDVEKGKSYIHTTKIVQHGPYAIIRHPQYLGGILFSISITLWNPIWLNLILSTIIIILIYQWTYSEDKKLVEKFEEDYKRYKETVPRLNPILGLIKYFSKKNKN